MMLYAEKFPNRRLPSAPTFIAVDRRARETGSLSRRRHVAGRPRMLLDVEERVLEAVNENPRTSTRRIAATVHTSQTTVRRILHRRQLHPYHYQSVQSLLPPILELFAKLAFSIDFPLMSGLELLVTGSLAHICYQIAFEARLIFDS
jgi:hypothetical protein